MTPAPELAWTRPWVGLRFDDFGRGPERFDCWGLFRALQAGRYGRALPAFREGYKHCDDIAAIDALIGANLADWCEVEDGEEKEGDGVLFLTEGKRCHVGLVIAPDWMLHIERGCDSVLECYRGFLWWRRIEGFYRYRPGAGPKSPEVSAGRVGPRPAVSVRCGPLSGSN